MIIQLFSFINKNGKILKNNFCTKNSMKTYLTNIHTLSKRFMNSKNSVRVKIHIDDTS